MEAAHNPLIKKVKKSDSDLVTQTDLKSEKIIKNFIIKNFPGHSILAEESDQINNTSDYLWVVDPLDGTTNFANGRDKFAIMIALTFKEKILRSWIYKPLDKIMCSAIVNEGAYINNNKVVTKVTNIIEESIGSISTKYWEPAFKDQLKILKNIFKEVNSYRCIGFEYIDIGIGIRNFAILSKLSKYLVTDIFRRFVRLRCMFQGPANIKDAETQEKLICVCVCACVPVYVCAE